MLAPVQENCRTALLVWSPTVTMKLTLPVVEQKHANEMLRQYYQDISFRLSQVEQQNRDVQWKMMTQSSPCHLDGPSDNFSSSQPDGAFDSFTLAHPGGHSDDFSSARPGGAFENFTSAYPMAVPTEIVLATNRRKRVALAVETGLREDLVQGGIADNNEGLHDGVDVDLTSGMNAGSVASVIPGSFNEVCATTFTTPRVLLIYTGCRNLRSRRPSMCPPCPWTRLHPIERSNLSCRPHL
jgi:hypothetical protein